MSNGNTQRRRPVEVRTVEDRLRAAFPEIDIEKIAATSQTLNEHNLSEKWAATVRTMQFWVDLIQ